MKTIRLFVTKNKTAFIIAVVIFVAGSVLGAVSSCRLEPSEADELKEYISPYLDIDIASMLDRGTVFAADCINHIRFILMAILCSVSIYLVPVFAFVLALKGYQLGFAAGFVSSYFGAGGTALALSSTFVFYLFALPVYFCVFVCLLRFGANIKLNLAHMSVRERTREYFYFILVMLVACSLLCVSAWVGALITPLVADFMN